MSSTSSTDVAAATLWQKGLTSFCERRYGDAIRAFSALLHELPCDTQALCNRAACFLAVELYRHTIRDCDAALSADPTCVPAYVRKGAALFAMERPEEAYHVWEQGAQCGAGDVAYHLELHSYMKRGFCRSGGEDGNRSDERVPGPAPDVSEEPSPPTTPSNPDTEPPPDPPALRIEVKRDTPVEDLSLMEIQAALRNREVKLGVDEQIAFGFLHVNAGNYQQGIELFTTLLRKNSKLASAYVGRGTALALTGRVDEAARDFTAAIEINPKDDDALKRRGQAYAAIGRNREALNDLSACLALNPDFEAYHQRGLVYHNLRNFRRGVADFQHAVELDDAKPATWNLLGVCQNSTGDCAKAVESYKRASQLDPKFKEAWVNQGQSYRDRGMGLEANACFSKAISVHPSYPYAYYVRGLLKHGMGNYREAIEDFTKVVSLDSKHVEGLYMTGICCQGLGRFRAALESYDRALAVNSQHTAWYLRRYLHYCQRRLDTPFSAYSADRELDPNVKEGWCKKHPPHCLPRIKEPKPFDKSIADVVIPDEGSRPDLVKVLAAAKVLGVRIQYDSPGFLPNVRQQRAAGLAILHIAQRMRPVWTPGGPPPPGWREFFAIPVTWRQISEPNDPVWWVDLLTPRQFREGFGSHTPLLSGQARVVRYHPHWERAFALMKEMMLGQMALSRLVSDELKSAKSCADLYELLQRDFWVMTYCFSASRRGHVLEGTRLVQEVREPEGFEFSIRTPGTPARWSDYNTELKTIWSQLCKAARDPRRDVARVRDLILTFVYYWYNFMPLSRGTALVGLTAMLGLFLALGYETSPCIKGAQIDWEALLTPQATDFVARVRPWVESSWCSSSILDGLPPLEETMATLRRRLEALNYPY